MTLPVDANKPSLVVLALHALGGVADLEHIAVKAYEMFPDQFCWRAFPEYPDKDAVRVHLSDAKKKKFGELVTDTDLRFERRGSEGYTKRYTLTRAGIAHAVDLETRLRHNPGGAGSITASRNSLDFKRIVAPILSSTAFKEFSQGRAMSDIGRGPYLQAFKLFPDASAFIIASRLNRVVSALTSAPTHERGQLEVFIQRGRDAFDL